MRVSAEGVVKVGRSRTEARKRQNEAGRKMTRKEKEASEEDVCQYIGREVARKHTR